MKKLLVLLIVFLTAAVLVIPACHADNGEAGKGATGQKAEPESVEVKSRSVNIWSDGTRLSGDLWYPGNASEKDKLPAIIMCHGWGGVRSHLNGAYAPLFAEAGFVVLTFDYRGWGDSDSRLVSRANMPAPDKDGMVTVTAQAIRELVDPFDQTEDIINCVNFISGESMVDPNRIGLWGTSYGGGHVLYVATHDDRIKCIVSQVPSMDSTVWFQEDQSRMEEIRETTIKRSRGEMDPVPQGVNKVPGLNGTPYWCRIAHYSPVRSAHTLKIPVLIIVAEKEELMDNKQHGEKVYNIVKDRVPSNYIVFKGTHFQIYDEGRIKSINDAVEWFNKHL